MGLKPEENERTTCFRRECRCLAQPVCLDTAFCVVPQQHAHDNARVGNLKNSCHPRHAIGVAPWVQYENRRLLPSAATGQSSCKTLLLVVTSPVADESQDRASVTYECTCSVCVLCCGRAFACNWTDAPCQHIHMHGNISTYPSTSTRHPSAHIRITTHIRSMSHNVNS